MTANGNWRDVSQRYGRQRGGLAAILLTRDRFAIVTSSNNTYGIAAQISRNLFQYYGADSVIRLKQEPGSPLPQGEIGTVITIASSTDLAPSELQSYPIRIEGGKLTLRRDQAEAARQYNFEPGLGAVFLRPLQDERVELVVWGADESGLENAARLVPTLTGSGQPDFIITCKDSRWKGVGGAYALGFLDSSWNISRASFIR
jgi:hypothetical protein